MSENENVILPNRYVIVQRKGFGLKVHKIPENPSSNNACKFGRDTIDLSNTVGLDYWTCFKMIPAKKKRHYVLEKCEVPSKISDSILKIRSSGLDNRDIEDDGSSQKLTTDEIIDLKGQGLSSEEIVSTIVQNSTSFAQKTEFSQEKYLKKKESKYCDVVIVRKPTYRLVAQALMSNYKRLEALNLRIDSLAQINTICCVRSGGVYMVCEDYCCGLITAGVLNAVGDEGIVINVLCGDDFQSPNALHYLNFPRDRLSQVLSVRIRNLVGANQSSSPVQVGNDGLAVSNVNARKRSCTEQDDCPSTRKKLRKEEEQEKIFEILRHRQVDGVIIVGRNYPTSILRVLLKYLEDSRSFVVYCPIREPLLELFEELRARRDVVALKLTESWLRSYQVLPERTHPDINMSGSGGFLLSGIKVEANN